MKRSNWSCLSPLICPSVRFIPEYRLLLVFISRQTALWLHKLHSIILTTSSPALTLTLLSFDLAHIFHTFVNSSSELMRLCTHNLHTKTWVRQWHTVALTCAGAAPWLPTPNAYPSHRHDKILYVKNITGTHTLITTANSYLQTTHTYTTINTDTLLNTHWAIHTGLLQTAHTSQLKASQSVRARVHACVCKKREWHVQGPLFSDLLVLRLLRWCGCYLPVAVVVRGMEYGPTSLMLLWSRGSSAP